MKARVHIFYKDSVFDPQGNTLVHSLLSMGFGTVKKVRVGKAIDIELDAGTEQAARHQIREMCDKLLANPVIESYTIEVEGAANP